MGVITATEANLAAYMANRTKVVAKTYMDKDPAFAIADGKEYDTVGRRWFRRLSQRPVGGGAIIGTAGALNSLGTQKDLDQYELDQAELSVSLQLPRGVVNQIKKGNFNELGSYTYDAECEFRYMFGLMLMGNGDGIIATNATGAASQTILTGVRGMIAGTNLQPQHLKRGMYVQIGVGVPGGGVAENAVISSVTWDGTGTKTCTVVVSANLTYSHVAASIYYYGAGVAGAVIPPGIQYLLNNNNAIGKSGNQINRATAANSVHRCIVKDMDDISGNFADDPLAVYSAMVGNINANSANGDGGVDTVLQHEAINQWLVRTERNRSNTFNLIENGKMWGYPVMKDPLTGINFIRNAYGAPFGKSFIFRAKDIDKPTDQGPEWMEGTTGSVFIRKPGYILFEACYIWAGTFDLAGPLSRGGVITGILNERIAGGGVEYPYMDAGA